MLHLPYIGVTDVVSANQIARLLQVFKRCRGTTGKQQHRLHVGVMMSWKTLYGVSTRWSSVFPPNEMIAGIFAGRSPDLIQCIHFADLENEPRLDQSLAKVIQFGGPNMHAIQLDMTWPDPTELATAVAAAPARPTPIEVILQIGPVALNQANNNPGAVVKRLRAYRGLVDHVLFDKSAGKGLGMDAAGLLPFLRATRDEFPDLGLAVAGGLGPHAMHLLDPLLKEFPGISIDAQGRLRPSGDIAHPIDEDMTSAYLLAALRKLA